MDTLDLIERLPLEERERTIKYKIVFLEEIQNRQNRQNQFTVMDFTYRRMRHGPGRSRQGHLTEDFQLDDNTGFGEQTCAIWHRQSGYMAMQYNHFGVRPSAIAEYLSMFAIGPDLGAEQPLQLTPVLRRDVYETLARSEIQSKITFGLDHNSAPPPDDGHIGGVSVGQLFRFRDRANAGNLVMTLSAGRFRRYGTSVSTARIVEQIMRCNPFKLEVTAKIDEDAPTEILNLINQLHIDEVPDNELRLTAGRRWPLDERVRAIQMRFNSWLRRRQLL